MPFYWLDREIKKDSLLSISFIESNTEWDFSNGFAINNLGVYNVLLRNKERNEFKFIKVSIILQHSSIHIIIDEEKPDSTSIKIRNETKDISITAFQLGTNPKDGFTVAPGKTIPYAWLLPSGKKAIYADYSTEDVLNYHSIENKYSFEELTSKIATEVPVGYEKKTKVEVSIAIEGNSRVMRFTPPEEKKEEIKGKDDKTPKKVIEIALKGVGISLISKVGNEKKMEKGEKLFSGR